MASILKAGQVAEKTVAHSPTAVVPHSMHRVAVGPNGEVPKCRVHLIKADGAVSAIEVQCGCGEKLLIELQYD